MTSKVKLINKLLNNPQNLNYSEIETLFKNNKYIIKEWKWSHKRIIFKENPKVFATIAIHNNDCKFSGKKSLQELYKLTNE
jgi:hypothetical protein